MLQLIVINNIVNIIIIIIIIIITQNVWEQNSGRGVAVAPLKITYFRSEFSFYSSLKKKVSEHDERKRQGQNNDQRNGSFRELYSTLSISDIL